MAHRTLLFTHLPEDLATIGRALRDAGHTVFPARFHEDSIDALIRVAPEIVLIDITYLGAIVSAEFHGHARLLPVKVLLFMRAQGTDDAAALQLVRGLPFPVLEYTGDAKALAALVDEVLAGEFG